MANKSQTFVSSILQAMTPNNNCHIPLEIENLVSGNKIGEFHMHIHNDNSLPGVSSSSPTSGIDEPITISPHVIIYDEKNSHGRQDTGNMLIHGDNLFALKVLETKFAGKVKCVFIDPPYFSHRYNHKNGLDANIEHSNWLKFMKPRLELLRNLISDDGSIWICIDDTEEAYLKMLCDDIWGRKWFNTMISWQRKCNAICMNHRFDTIGEYILVYSKSNLFTPNNLHRTKESLSGYDNPDNDPRGPWRAVSYFGPATVKQQANLFYDIINPNTGEIIKNNNRAWKFTQEKHKINEQKNRVWWGENGRSHMPQLKYFLSDAPQDIAPNNWWTAQDVGDAVEARREQVAIFGSDAAFSGSKPERLIQRILEIATNPGDLILDSFLGSGTTAAVAHKMNRRYIGVEMDDHAYTHCKVRLDKVIDGKDAGGITKAVNWQGGGGYCFYELAPTLIKKDSFGKPVISEEYDAEKLAIAVALHEGYTYMPDSIIFWKQARRSEKSWLYTTTRTIITAYLEFIVQDLKEDELLTIVTTSFAPELARAYKNVTLHLIPQTLLKKCILGAEEDSSPIVNPPKADKFTD